MDDTQGANAEIEENLDSWLTQNKLQKFSSVFSELGYEDVESLGVFTSVEDFREVFGTKLKVSEFTPIHDVLKQL
ncbi:MAG: hypothetical protein GY820_21500 [Gammaproteobacteria bacterium]|nr:hypothetical protein [Gammaproteobacteria bacterium]